MQIEFGTRLAQNTAMPDRFREDLHLLTRPELLRQFLSANDDFLHEAKQLSFRDAKPPAYAEAKDRLHSLMNELKRRGNKLA